MHAQASSAPAPELPRDAGNPREIVHRPEPGLARGLFEAPPWAFVGFGVVLLAFVGTWAVWKLSLRRAHSPRRPSRR